MLTKEQALTPIPINCYDAVIITQLIEKLLRNGLITGKELAVVAGLRVKLTGTVQQSIGVDLDNPDQEAQTEANDAE